MRDLAARHQDARKHDIVRLHYRATYTGRNASNAETMLEAIIHRRGNRRGYNYARHWGYVSVARFGAGSWKVLRDRTYPPKLEIYIVATPLPETLLSLTEVQLAARGHLVDDPR